MVFLTSLYEKRFNSNMSRHRLDVKIAPSRPKPSCRPVFYDHVDTVCGAKSKIAVTEHFLKAKDEVQSNNIHQQFIQASPIYTPREKLELSLAAAGPCTSIDSGKNVVVESFKPLARSGSEESGIFTSSDAVSNASFQT